MAESDVRKSTVIYDWNPDPPITLNVTHNDPQFELGGKLPARIPAGATMRIRMSATAGAELQVFWGGIYNEYDSLRAKLIPDGKLRDYIITFPRAITPTRMRLDPTDSPGFVRVERVTIETVEGPEAGIGAFFMDSAVPRAGRAERVCAIIENTGSSNAELRLVLRVHTQGVKLMDKPEYILTLVTNEVRLVYWRLVAEAPCRADIELSLSVKNGSSVACRLFPVFFEQVKLGRCTYVPEPVPPRTSYIIGAMYFPGWKQGTHYGWQRIVPFPERKPALGWYDENNPEVTDWEIKWAVEHGLSFFAYCWYRKRENVGHPVTVQDIYLGHAIHEGFFNARYRDKFKFCILWEVANAGGVSSTDDLLQNLLPFWLNTYFKHPSYLKLDNKPVVFVFEWGAWQNNVAKPLGGTPEKVREALDSVRAACRKAGFDGLLLFVEGRNPGEGWLKELFANGIDGGFPYCHANGLVQAFRPSAPGMSAYLPTVSMGWNSGPWEAGWEFGWRKNAGGRLLPSSFREACGKVKAVVDAFPDRGKPEHRLILIDNWNEWGEGHYIMPNREHGFGYLDAIREVFTDSVSAPHIDITPEDIGLGPYDSLFREALRKKLDHADGLIRELLK
jgi:hypothetical protein